MKSGVLVTGGFYEVVALLSLFLSTISSRNDTTTFRNYSDIHVHFTFGHASETTRNARSKEYIAAVRQRICDNSSLSILRRP